MLERFGGKWAPISKADNLTTQYWILNTYIQSLWTVFPQFCLCHPPQHYKISRSWLVADISKVMQAKKKRLESLTKNYMKGSQHKLEQLWNNYHGQRFDFLLPVQQKNNSKKCWWNCWFCRQSSHSQKWCEPHKCSLTFLLVNIQPFYFLKMFTYGLQLINKIC